MNNGRRFCNHFFLSLVFVKNLFVALGILGLLLADSSAEDLVCINDFIPGIIVELPYATTDNFCKKQFYPEHRAYLLKPVAIKLAKVQADLEKQGLGLKLWDGYRPLAVQRELWKVMPNPRFVANPTKGSRHNRGAAVDLTLVNADGNELAMPTAYDVFTPKAHARYLSLKPDILVNRKILQTVMVRHGFKIMNSEWWHFDAIGWEKYPVLDIPMEKLYRKTIPQAPIRARRITEVQLKP